MRRGVLYHNADLIKILHQNAPPHYLLFTKVPVSSRREAEGSPYIGFTSDIERRIKEHNHYKAHYTKDKSPGV